MRILGIVFAFLLLVLGLGWFAGWFSFSSETVAGERRVEMGVHGDEVEHDLDRAKEGARRVGESVGDAFDGDEDELADGEMAATTLLGVVSAIDAENERLTLRTAAGELETVRLGAQTAVELDGAPASAADLQPGHHVVVELPPAGATEGEAVRVIARR